MKIANKNEVVDVLLVNTKGRKQKTQRNWLFGTEKDIKESARFVRNEPDKIIIRTGKDIMHLLPSEKDCLEKEVLLTNENK